MEKSFRSQAGMSFETQTFRSKAECTDHVTKGTKLIWEDFLFSVYENRIIY